MLKGYTDVTNWAGIVGFVMLLLQTLYFSITNINGAQSYDGDSTYLQWTIFGLLVILPGIAVAVVNYAAKSDMSDTELKRTKLIIGALNATMVIGVVMSLGLAS